MAKAKANTTSATRVAKPKSRRKGVHSKKNHSNSKKAKFYVKKYNSQGRK